MPLPIKIETNEEYHSSEPVSKTTLWALDETTPFKARFGAPKESHAFDEGQAAHIAILEPHLLEKSVLKGPDDRRGNKWKEAEAEAKEKKMILVTSGQYDNVMMIRDLATTVPMLELVRKDFMAEVSGYYTDEETGLAVKVRPDLYSKSAGLIVDIKNMSDISKGSWQTTAGKYGYHMQDAMYSTGWEQASGMPVYGFVFMLFSKDTPPEYAIRELDADAKAEGYARYRRSLAKYKECLEANVWPSYGDVIETTSLHYKAYKINPAPARKEDD